MDKSKMVKLDEIIAHGHKNVLGKHGTTLEITKEDFLTPNGDCIIGIGSDKSVSDYCPELKKAIQTSQKIHVKLIGGDHEDDFHGYGNPKLTLTNEISMVFRKSTYICGRTALIRCTKTAKDINRDLINYLQNPNHHLKAELYVLQN